MRPAATGLALALALAAPAAGAGDPARGEEKSVTCRACHGPDGNSPVATFPIIAGQHEDYLLHSMRAYKDGSRSNAIMAAIVAPLADADLADLAAYYARQSGLRALGIELQPDAGH